MTFPQTVKRLSTRRETRVRPLGWGRSPGEGNGNPLQYSCLENPMDEGAWWATVHGVSKSRTRLSNFTRIQTQSLFPEFQKKTLSFLHFYQNISWKYWKALTKVQVKLNMVWIRLSLAYKMKQMTIKMIDSFKLIKTKDNNQQSITNKTKQNKKTGGKIQQSLISRN